MTKKIYTTLQLCVGLSIFLAILEAGNLVLEQLSCIRVSACHATDQRAPVYVHTTPGGLGHPASGINKKSS